jgi:low temperature requirement protein LtrA
VGADVDDRRATWLELFFDLVFVAAVGQLAIALSRHPTFPRFLGFVAVFVPVWWAWMGSPSTRTASTPTTCPTGC